MSPLSIFLLILSIVLAGGRTTLSKSISGIPFGERGFFVLQATIFGTGAVVLFAVNPTAFSGLLPISLLYGALYATLSVTSQWCYTVALRGGEASVCGTVYSMGFVIPTLAGMFFWQEEVSVPKIIGIALVIPTLIISGMKGKSSPHEQKRSGSIGYIIPLSAAMLAAGTLGILQKHLPTSASGSQISAVIIISFVFSFLTSLMGAVISKPMPKKSPKKSLLSAAGVGICFASCNFFNTLLAGMLDSTVLFPTLNIGIILFTLALGLIFFGEKFGWRQLAIILLGAASILLITFA